VAERSSQQSNRLAFPQGKPLPVKSSAPAVPLVPRKHANAAPKPAPQPLPLFLGAVQGPPSTTFRHVLGSPPHGVDSEKRRSINSRLTPVASFVPTDYEETRRQVVQLIPGTARPAAAPEKVGTIDESDEPPAQAVAVQPNSAGEAAVESPQQSQPAARVAFELPPPQPASASEPARPSEATAQTAFASTVAAAPPEQVEHGFWNSSPKYSAPPPSLLSQPPLPRPSSLRSAVAKVLFFLIVSAVLTLVWYEVSIMLRTPWLHPRALLLKSGLTRIDLHWLFAKLHRT
jgi:hypothetical protein